jgi:hypothetical protein
MPNVIVIATRAQKMTLPDPEGEPRVLGSYISMDPSLLDSFAADGTSAPNTPERSGKKRDNLFEDTSTSPVKKSKQKSTGQSTATAASAHDEGPDVVGGHSNPQGCSPPAADPLLMQGSKLCESSVMSLRGLDGRVRASSPRCRLDQCLGGGLWRVTVLGSGELREVAEKELAPIRKAPLSEPEDVQAPQWVKIGQADRPNNAVYFANWTTGRIMCIPREGGIDVPSDWQHASISIRLPHNANSVASTRLDWAMEEVNKLLMVPAPNFKVGITANPPERFRYYGDEWDRMVIIATSHVRQEVAQIEASLIKWYAGHPQCSNIARGGEGESKMGGQPFFTYVILSRA